MAIHPRPGECIYAGADSWRFFISYEGGQYHTVDVSRGCYYISYLWKVDSKLQASGSKTFSSREIPGLIARVLLGYSTSIPAISWDANGVATADVEQLETLHLRPDVSSVFRADGPGVMRHVTNTHITWDEPYVDKFGQKERRYHREGHPALILGTNLSKLADHTVTECGPAPSKGGTPVYVSGIHYYHHGIRHRDDGPSYTEGVCSCFTGDCKRVREWHQRGEYRTDRPCRVTCERQVWIPRDYRPMTVHRDGKLDWSSPTPERYTYWVHAGYARPVRLRFRAIAAATTVTGLANLTTWWVSE
jgi:hypothetical protein